MSGHWGKHNESILESWIFCKDGRTEPNCPKYAKKENKRATNKDNI